MFPEITRDDVFRLETERLWLRWPRMADAPAIAMLAGDPEVALKTALIPYPYETHHAERFIMAARAENAAGEGLSLVLAPKRQPNEAIGVIGAHGSANRGVAMLGFWLGKPYWGQGYMGEAGAAFVDLIFGVSSIENISSCALPTNADSLRVLEKLGFSRTGPGTMDAPARGGVVNVEWAKLTRGGAHTRFGARRPKLTST
jgi:RimJ/RimL family protein N-acetyltransferase